MQQLILVRCFKFSILLCAFFTSSVFSCSCSQYYMPLKAEPTWVVSQKSNDLISLASGAYQCSGIKSQDEKRADEAARVSLSKLINTHVISEERTAISVHNSIAKSKYQAIALQKSQQVLKGATIFDRWVDPQNCIVYSGIKVSQQDLQAGKAELEHQFKQKLIAHNTCIKASGEQSEQIKSLLSEELVQQGMMFNAAKKCEITYLINNQVELLKADAAINYLTIKVLHENRSIWHKTYKGKGVTFGGKSAIELFELAMADSIDLFHVDLMNEAKLERLPYE